MGIRSFTLAVVAAALVATGCLSSDLKLTRKAEASRHWHDGRYRLECTAQTEQCLGWRAEIQKDNVSHITQYRDGCVSKTPPCEAFKDLVNLAAKETTLADETQQRGPLPPSAKDELKRLMKDMEKANK